MDDPKLSGAIPWPSPDDNLFEGVSSNWGAMADVREGWSPQVTRYAAGYRRAAELLAEHVIRTGSDQDFLVYPIMFLYRQYVELRLKEIAVDSAQVLDRAPPEAKLLGNHEVEPLWGYCRELLEAMDEGPVTDLDNAERTLRQLHRADPGSFAFRYPTDKKGERALPSELEVIDIERVHTVMSGVGNLLDGIVEMVNVHQGWKDEMEREYPPDPSDF